MSGHGNFGIVGSGGNPQVFGPVGVAGPDSGAGAPPGAASPAGQGNGAVADPRLARANQVAAQLDALLLKVAKAASAPIDTGTPLPSHRGTLICRCIRGMTAERHKKWLPCKRSRLTMRVP